MSKENLKRIEELSQKIKIEFHKNSFGLFLGAYKTLFRGQGLAFQGHKTYDYNDDVRFLDWKILAKTGRLFLKTFEEERNVEIALVIDAGPSMQYGSDGISKLRVAFEIASLILFLAEKTKDKVFPYLITDKVIDCTEGRHKKMIEGLFSHLRKHSFVNLEGDFIPNYFVEQCNSKEVEKVISRNIESRRFVFVLSDMFSLFSYDFFAKVKKNKRTIFSRIVSPLDERKKMDFMLNGAKGKGFFSNNINYLGNAADSFFEDQILNKYKIITKEGYLEDFIKKINYVEN